jgi:hypothetical protein
MGISERPTDRVNLGPRADRSSPLCAILYRLDLTGETRSVPIGAPRKAPGSLTGSLLGVNINRWTMHFGCVRVAAAFLGVAFLKRDRPAYNCAEYRSKSCRGLGGNFGLLETL